MSLVLPPLFHWAPDTARAGIIRRGLKPTCHTADHRPNDEGAGWYVGESFLAVCLGTSPSHAWSLSGAIVADRGETWDLWQVTLDDGDEVHPLPFYGHRLAEFRVANTIPKGRCWHVGSRTVGARQWSIA